MRALVAVVMSMTYASGGTGVEKSGCDGGHSAVHAMDGRYSRGVEVTRCPGL